MTMLLAPSKAVLSGEKDGRQEKAADGHGPEGTDADPAAEADSQAASSDGAVEATPEAAPEAAPNGQVEDAAAPSAERPHGAAA